MGKLDITNFLDPRWFQDFSTRLQKVQGCDVLAKDQDLPWSQRGVRPGGPLGGFLLGFLGFSQLGTTEALFL